MARLPANKDGGSSGSGNALVGNPVTSGTLPNGTKFSWSTMPTVPAIPGMSREAITEWIRTGTNSAGNKVQLTNDQVSQIVNSVVASKPTSNAPLSSLAAGGGTTTTGGGTSTSSGKSSTNKSGAKNAVTSAIDKIIADTQQKMFDTSVFDTRRKYLQEQLATAQAAKAASEEQARLQYQALARIAQQQQAAALGSTGDIYTESAGDIASAGGAGAAIGGGMATATPEVMSEQQAADEAALREIGAIAAGGAQSAGVLQELINQAYGRDLTAAQMRQQGAIEAEQVAAQSQFEQQRMQDLAQMQLQRAQEVERILAAQRAAAAAAASRAASSAVNVPTVDMSTTLLGSKISSASNGKQTKTNDDGSPVLDNNGKKSTEPWGTYRTTVLVKGNPEPAAVPTSSMAGDVSNLGALVNYVMTDTTGQYKNYNQQQRVNQALALVAQGKKELVTNYGGVVALEALYAPTSAGGLGMPRSDSDFVRQATTGVK